MECLHGSPILVYVFLLSITHRSSRIFTSQSTQSSRIMPKLFSSDFLMTRALLYRWHGLTRKFELKRARSGSVPPLYRKHFQEGSLEFERKLQMKKFRLSLSGSGITMVPLFPGQRLRSTPVDSSDR